MPRPHVYERSETRSGRSIRLEPSENYGPAARTVVASAICRPATIPNGGLRLTNAEALAYRIVQSMSLQWKRKRIGSERIRRGVRMWALLKTE